MAAAARRRGPSRRGLYSRTQGPTHDILSLSDLTPAQHCCARLGGSVWRPPGTRNRRRKSQCATPRTGPAPANSYIAGIICRWQQRSRRVNRAGHVLRSCSLEALAQRAPLLSLLAVGWRAKPLSSSQEPEPLSPVLRPCACARAGTWSRPLTASGNINCPLSARPFQCPGRGAQTGQFPAAGELCEKRS